MIFGTSDSKKENKNSRDVMTIIGEMSVVEGSFTSDADAEINGNVEGEIDVNGKLIIGETAKIKSSIKAEELSVKGDVIGNIDVAGNVVIDRSGRVTGDITLGGDLIIEPGAVFIGASKMQERTVANNIDDLELDDTDSLDDDLDID